MRCVTRLAVVAALSIPSSVSAQMLDPGVVEGLQVGIGACSFAEPRPKDGGEDRAILEALATAAISKGVNMLASAIAEAGKTKTWSAAGSRNFQASSSTFPQCVQVARGRFYLDRTDLGPWATAWSGRSEALKSNGLFLADHPDFFFEGEFVGSADQAALSIRPVFSGFVEPIGTRWLRPGRKRSIAVFLSITPPGTKAALETAPAATLILGEHAPGARRRYAKGGETYSGPLEASWFTFAKADATKPFTIHTLVTETQGGSDFYEFVGAVVNDDKVKQATTTGVAELLIPSVGAAASATERQTAATAQNTADERLGTALEKLSACAKAITGQVAAGSSAKVALRNYQIADRALDKDDRSNLVTQSQIDQIDLRAPEGLPAACQAVYDNLT